MNKDDKDSYTRKNRRPILGIYKVVLINTRVGVEEKTYVFSEDFLIKSSEKFIDKLNKIACR